VTRSRPWIHSRRLACCPRHTDCLMSFPHASASIQTSPCIAWYCPLSFCRHAPPLPCARSALSFSSLMPQVPPALAACSYRRRSSSNATLCCASCFRAVYILRTKSSTDSVPQRSSPSLSHLSPLFFRTHNGFSSPGLFLATRPNSGVNTMSAFLAIHSLQI
jgi:hypothetical protein